MQQTKLHTKDDIDLNLWYTIDEVTPLFCMSKNKIRSLFVKYEARLNSGRLFPMVFKTEGKWQIIGNTLITLLDIVNEEIKGDKTMTKKSFTDNAAMQFISAQQEEQTPEEVAEQKDRTPFRVEGDIKTAKNINFEYIQNSAERKTKRVQLVLKPSLFDKLKATSAAQGASVNDYVCQLLERVLADN